MKKALILVLIIACGFLGYSLTKKTQKGYEEVRITEAPQEVKGAAVTPVSEKEVGDFSVGRDDVCKQDGKPVVYFFGSTSCSHCIWEKPVIKKTAEKFGKEIVYKENIDSQNDSDIFVKYQNFNPQGYVPFLILGCKYFRTGSGETFGEKVEEENLTSLLCKLTDGKPSSVCASLKN